MATYVPPKRATAFIMYAGLTQQADTRLLKSTPTLAAGDFKSAQDGSAFNNLGTLPTVTPAATTSVKFALSGTEMTADNVQITCIDAAGAEWCDQFYNVATAARQIDDLAYPATSGRSMVVDANGLIDATAIKVGPTGAATAQTARDLGLSVLVGDKTGFSLSAAGIQAIWDALTAALTTIGSIGKLIVTNLDALITSRLAPTVAARTLDVSATGEAGIDWANVGAPTTVLALTGTTVKAATDVTNDVGITQTGADKVWGTAARTLTSFGTLVADVWASATRLLTAGTNIVLAKGVGVTGFNDPTAAANADAVWDEAIAGHLGVGSTGEALNGAGGGGGGDPWATAIPGAYGAGTAGKIVGDNLNATVGSRAQPTDVPGVAAIVAAFLAGDMGGGRTVRDAIAGGLLNIVQSDDGTTITVKDGGGAVLFTQTVTRANFKSYKSTV